MIIDGEPWFVGKDVAAILGYANPNEAIQDHVDGEDKLNSKTLLSFALDLGQRGGWLINEPGLYSLILSSKLPDAKRFKRWVTSEVLPALRKTGTYELQHLEASQKSCFPTRPLTTDDYIDAGKTIAKCDNKRLSLVLDMFRKAGLDVAEITTMREESDSPKTELVDLLNQFTFKELCERLPICKSSIYYYMTGRHVPKEKRRSEIIRILEG